ncbi:MAG: phosphate regulon sensor histidine kinase PhoR [Methylotenera sp.]|nr:phosphate regulon sensor histidine kinase PhoR [Methylotenera sp.]
MLDLRWKALAYIATLSVICIFVWMMSGLVIALVAYIIGLLVYLAGHCYWLQQLYLWLHKPTLNDVPEGSGVWEDVYTALLRYERINQTKQTELNAALERFDITANAIPDGLVVLNASNEIEWCTQHAENQLGINLKTDQHIPIFNLVRNSDFIAYLYHEVYQAPFRLKHHRQEVSLEISLIPLAEQYKLLICRDVTQVEKVDAMRRDFIANVSHELRTPLTVVSGFIETLSDMEGTIPQSIRHYFDMMHEQTTRMRRLIEDLLTLSQIESNVQLPEDQTINMSDMVNMLLNDARALSQGRHRIDAEIASNVNLAGSVDELQSALGNLVSNAIRYTPAGGAILLKWQLRGKQAIFSVCDNGIGIESHHIERLTERFYRVDRSRSRETGGTGLGLAIVKHILTRHQAGLEVTSKLGEGSTFSAVFPKTRVRQI